MKKILGLSLALIAVVAMLGTGTWAYFNDVVKSTGNTFTAGTLSLSVGGIGSGHFDIGSPILDFRPDDKGTAGFYSISTNGTINGDLYIKAANLKNYENGRNAVELAANDTTPGAEEGELGGLLTIAIWMDVNNSGVWAAGDYYIDSSGAKVAYTGSEPAPTIDTIHFVPNAAYSIANTVLGAFTGTTALATNLPGGTTVGKLYVDYYFPNTGGDHFTVNADNQAQSDSLVFDLDFALVQAGK